MCITLWKSLSSAVSPPHMTLKATIALSATFFIRISFGCCACLSALPQLPDLVLEMVVDRMFLRSIPRFLGHAVSLFIFIDIMHYMQSLSSFSTGILPLVSIMLLESLKVHEGFRTLHEDQGRLSMLKNVNNNFSYQNKQRGRYAFFISIISNL